jgi:hypothetical protein
MRTLSSPLIFILFVSAACFLGCEKETFDVTITDVETPGPEAISAVDCPALMLNVGDVCELNGQEGMVSAGCACVTPDSGDLISIEFINDLGTEIIVTVETDPLFLAGSTYVVVPASGTSVSYFLPDGTMEFSCATYFPCSNIGVATDIALYSSPFSVEGANVQLDVGCP